MSLFQFFKDSINELSHVVWPTKKESRTYMIYVVGVIVFMSILLAVFGFIFKTGLKETKQIVNPSQNDYLQDIVNNINTNTPSVNMEHPENNTTTEENNNTEDATQQPAEVPSENTNTETSTGSTQS